MIFFAHQCVESGRTDTNTGAFEEMLASDGEPLDRQTGEPRVVCCYVGNLAGTSQDVQRYLKILTLRSPPPACGRSGTPPPRTPPATAMYAVAFPP